MTDRERMAFCVGVAAGGLIATVGWWVDLLMTRAML